MPDDTGPAPPRLVHGSALRLAGRGLLLTGPARAGKSALLFMTLRRAEAAGLDARLLADDGALLEPGGDGRLLLRAPAPTRGLIEVSGVGLLAEPAIEAVPLDLLVELAPTDRGPARLPEAAEVCFEGVAVRRIVLPPREAALGAEILVHLARRGFADLGAPAEDASGAGLHPV